MRKTDQKPKTASREKRKRRAIVFLTDAEFEEMRRAAGVVRLPVFLRRAGLGQRPAIVVSPENVEAIRALVQIGRNVNQLARAANAAGDRHHVEVFEEAAAQIAHVVEVLSGAGA